MSLTTNLSRFMSVTREHGLGRTLAVAGSVLEDNHLRLFDRRFGVKTSGFIRLEATSIAGANIDNLHRYRAVNAWAFRRALHLAGRRAAGSFVDLGCGLGRACLLAARYGQFSSITGVELVPEFSQHARRNVAAYQERFMPRQPIAILTMDAVRYTREFDADVYFMFRPFSGPILAAVLDNIVASAARRQTTPLILYSERLLQSSSNQPLFDANPAFTRMFTLHRWGQLFFGYVVGARKN